MNASRSMPVPMKTSSWRRSPQTSLQTASSRSRNSGSFGQRRRGTADHQNPIAETRATAPAKEKSPTQSGRVASQKWPLARIRPGQVALTKALNRAGSNGRRAR